MKEYYKLRWHWVFNYTSKNFGYCLLKTLCLIIGLPIYSVMFVLEMVLTAINMIFSWIPILNTVIFIICKALMVVFGSTFYICILTDVKKYKAVVSEVIQYDVADADGEPSELVGIETSDASATADSNAETVDAAENNVDAPYDEEK